MLTIDFKGKKKAIIFFLDKDIDDLLEKQIISEHVVYTQYYDLENHLFTIGDVIKGAASATQRTTQQVRKIISDPNHWMFKVAKEWLDYVKLCFFAVKHPQLTKNIEVRYGKEVLPPIFKPTDYQAYISNRMYSEISKLIDNLYASGKYNTVFNGKWYANLLDRELTQANGFHKEILKSIQATLDFNATWADYFKQPLRRLLITVGLLPSN